LSAIVFPKALRSNGDVSRGKDALERGKVDDDGPRRQTTTTTERMTTRTTTTIRDNECAANHRTHTPAQVLFVKALAPYLNGIRP
jgi:hypothetical protein